MPKPLIDFLVYELTLASIVVGLVGATLWSLCKAAWALIYPKK
jgi:hypothetical protein